jgi:erythromycin esterase-like protein
MSYAGVAQMGDHVHARLGDDLYTIAFTAYQGEVGILPPPESGKEPHANPISKSPPAAGSLEDLCHRIDAIRADRSARRARRSLAAPAARRMAARLLPQPGRLEPGRRRVLLHRRDDARSAVVGAAGQRSMRRRARRHEKD